MFKPDYIAKRWEPAERDAMLSYLLDTATPADAASEVEIASLGDYDAEIRHAYENWNKMEGLSTGLPTLDKMTMGLVGGEMTVIGGATSQGKTALALNITTNVAKTGRSVLFVTLEMTHKQAGVRIRHIAGDQETYEELLPWIFFQKQDELSWRSIDRLMEKAKSYCGAELVVVDHLHYFTREIQNVAEELGNITKEIKKNAMRHDLPVILVSHTRKSANSRDTSTGINDLRGSSYIAQDSDCVLMVERTVEEDMQPDAKPMIAVSLEKNRNRSGLPVGTKRMFAFDQTRITELRKAQKGLAVSVGQE